MTPPGTSPVSAPMRSRAGCSGWPAASRNLAQAVPRRLRSPGARGGGAGPWPRRDRASEPLGRDKRDDFVTACCTPGGAIEIELPRGGGRSQAASSWLRIPDAFLAPGWPQADQHAGVLVRAHRWRRRIESGRAKSITDLAEQEGVTVAYVCRLLPLTCLAPDIVEAILDGRQPKGLRLAEMLGNVPLAWDGQRATLGS